MKTIDDYVDVRDIHPDWKTSTCYSCGVKRRFKHSTWSGAQAWICQECNDRQHHDIEIICESCLSPLRDLSADTTCAVCGHENDIDKERLRDKICDRTAFMSGVDKPGVLMGDCPFCEGEATVNGDPDGALVCDGGPPISEFIAGPGCFYAGQYSDEWYAYALWRIEPNEVVVRDE